MAKFLGRWRRQPPLAFTIESGEIADRLSLSKEFSYLLICIERPHSGAVDGEHVDLWTSIATNIVPETAVEVLDLAKTACKNRGSAEFQWSQSKAGELLSTSLANRAEREGKKPN